MRTYDQAMADALDETPFSNHTMWEIWADRWCYECVNDSPELVDQGKGCPLIMVALMRKTPREWTAATEQDRIYGSYHCSEFEQRNDGGGDGESGPQPRPPAFEEMPGQTTIFEALTDATVEQFQQTPEAVTA
jgi:hypothetical protein